MIHEPYVCVSHLPTVEGLGRPGTAGRDVLLLVSSCSSSARACVIMDREASTAGLGCWFASQLLSGVVVVLTPSKRQME